ncbi:MAG: SDR family NAD(P)-dependent oxidoreductase [Acidimicrobiia bacterium]
MGVLTGKRVVVTGSGRGLGAAYAEAAADEGALVVVNDIDADCAEQVADRIVERGGTAVPCGGSVADWSEARALVERCIAEFGSLDGLVNNAGVFYLRRPGEDDEAELRRTVETNVLGALYCGTHAIRAMTQQGHGCIVNVTSGAQCGMSLMATYGATKGAIASVTYGWAVDLAPLGIRVNAVSPAARTRMVDELERHRPSAVNWPAETVAPLVTFLLSDRAAHITGQVIRLIGRELSLMAHPVPAPPFLERDRWTVDELARVLAPNRADHLHPYGLGATAYERPVKRATQ